MPQLLSLGSRARKPRLKHVHPRAHASQQEKPPPVRSSSTATGEEPLLTTTTEKPAQQQSSQKQINRRIQGINTGRVIQVVAAGLPTESSQTMSPSSLLHWNLTTWVSLKADEREAEAEGPGGLGKSQSPGWSVPSLAAAPLVMRWVIWR